MPSSTSSSEPHGEAQPKADSSPFGTLGAGLLLLAVSLVLVRLIAAAAVSREPLAFGPTHPRIEEVRARLPVITAQREKAVLAIGSSQLWNGFSPAVVDAALAARGKPVTSYNLGFNGLGPSTARLLLERLAAAYAAGSTRPSLVVFEFTPFLATKKARAAGWSDEPNMQLGTLGSFAAEARRAPARALGVAAYHYLLGGFSPGRFKDFGEGVIYGSFSPCGSTRVTSRAAQAASDALCRDLLHVFPGGLPAWNEEARGFRALVYPETAESYLALALTMRDPSLLQRDFAWRNKAVDLVHLDLDPGLVAEVVAAVKQARALAPSVFVFAPPVNPAWVRRSEAGRARFLDAAAQIEREAGVPVTDLTEDPAFAPEDFIDTTHLNQLTGAQKLSTMIAEKLLPLL
jgi:hypothetical protein